MQQAGGSFAGASFHCYSGSVGQQDTFHNAFPSKEVYFTECSGSQGSDWWSDIKARRHFRISVSITLMQSISGTWTIYTSVPWSTGLLLSQCKSIGNHLSGVLRLTAVNQVEFGP